VNQDISRLIDKLFIRRIKNIRDPEAGPQDDYAGTFVKLLERFHKLKASEKVFGEELKQKFMHAYPENFDELEVIFDTKMPGLPAPLPNSRPPIYHFHPPRKKAWASLVLIHGWRQPVLGAVGRFAKYCAARGIASVAVELPGHLQRRIKGRPSGDGFTSIDPEIFLPTLFHTAVEVESARRFLKSVYPDLPAGILGVSIGGWMATLCCMAFYPEYVYLVSPVVAPEKMFEQSDLLMRRRAEAEKTGIGVDAVVEAISQVSPMRNTPLISGNRIGVIAPRYDLVVAYSDVLDFTRLWETQEIEPIDFGHISMIYFYNELFQHIFKSLKNLITNLPEWE